MRRFVPVYFVTLLAAATTASAQLELTLVSLTDVGPLTLAGMGGADFDDATGRLWISDGCGPGCPTAGTNRVYQIDPITGLVHSFFDAAVVPGLDVGADAVARHPATGDLFIFSPYIEDEGGRVSPNGVLVKDFGHSYQAPAAACSPAGDLYVVADTNAGGDGRLHKIDASTGAVSSSTTLAGPTMRVASMDLDPSTGNLFVFDDLTDDLVEIDVATGARLSQTDLSALGITPAMHFATAFAFNADGSRIYFGKGTAADAHVLRVFDRTISAWSDVGCELAGVSGAPVLAGSGSLAVGTQNSIDLSNAAPNAFAVLFASLSSTPAPFFGGTLKPFPPVVTLSLGTGPAGVVALPFVMPAGVPGGVNLYVQYGIQDAAAIQGVALSNAVVGIAP